MRAFQGENTVIRVEKSNREYRAVLDQVVGQVWAK